MTQESSDRIMVDVLVPMRVIGSDRLLDERKMRKNEGVEKRSSKKETGILEILKV